MFFQYDTKGNEKQTGEEESQWWARQLERYLTPYSERLDAYLDRRVVGNLTATVAGIVQTRSELTTSELGSAICGPEHAEAGTQRLQRALHHHGWASEVIEEVLWELAETSRKEMEQRGETPLCIWDSSVLEKPESEKLEGLGSLRSSRVWRLARSRKSVFNRPSGMPVSVRGFEWESLLLVGKSAVPQVIAMRWWSREKGVSGQQRHQQQSLLSQAALRWGRKVRHVFDRGYGTAPRTSASVDEPGALCRALEERQQTHRCVGAGAQSLGNRAWQTALGRSPTALGHAFPPLSQHPRARFAGSTPRVWRPVVVGGGATRQGARTLVSAHR